MFELAYCTPTFGTLTDLTIMQGETVAKTIQIVPKDGGPPLNLGGYLVKGRIDFPTPLDLSLGNGGFTLIDAGNGLLRLNIPSATTAEIPPCGYPYDVWTVSANGTEKSHLRGRFIVVPTVTPVP